MSDPTIPAEAVQAAAQALQQISCPHTLGWSCVNCRARAAVEAAAPFIAEQARREAAEHIASLIEAVDPVEWALAGQRAGQDAARIAREAFPKGADQ